MNYMHKTHQFTSTHSSQWCLLISLILLSDNIHVFSPIKTEILFKLAKEKRF